MERKIGERFKYNGVMLEVASKYADLASCANCFFFHEEKTFCSKIKCDMIERRDFTNVYFKEGGMTHKIFKVINFYYIHLDDKRQLCPLADYISENNPEIEVLEVRYNPQAEQGVVIVKTDDYKAYSRLNNVVDLFKNDII